MTRSAEYLDGIKKHHSEWYKHYSQRPLKKHTLTLTTTTHPNVLHEDKSMYDRRKMFDAITKEAESFYKLRGLRVITTGPIGLGAGGLSLGALYEHILLTGTAVIHWLNEHRLTVTFARLIIPLAKTIKTYIKNAAEKRYIKALRQAQVRMCLSLTLYVNEGNKSEDIVPYAQQLFVSSRELSNIFEKELTYIHVFINCTVIDIHSDKSVSIGPIANYTDRSMARTLQKLQKIDPDMPKIRITPK